jgi:hypothetical protein
MSADGPVNRKFATFPYFNSSDGNFWLYTDKNMDVDI